MSTTVPLRHLRVDVIDKRFEILDLVNYLDLPLDGAVHEDPKLETLMVLLDASYSLLRHVAAIVEHDGATLSPQQLALVR
jgi:hypothetical protein